MNRNEFFQTLTITSLQFRLTSAMIEICTDDIDDIHVMVSGAKADVEALRIIESEGALTLEQPVTALAKTAAADSNWMQLAIRLPRSWKGAITGRTVSGWITLRGLSGTDLSVDTVSGLITGQGLDFITARAHSVSGDIKLSQLHCDRCGLFSTAGIMTAQSTSLHSCAVNTVSGLVTLELTEPFEELTLNSVSGSLCVDAPVTECDAVLRSVSGRIRTGGVSIQEGAPKLRANTVSGNLDITCTLA